MASELKVDKFTGVTTAGSIDVTGEGNSTTTNLQQGLCKAWSQHNGGGTVADSFNSSHTTDHGTADNTFSFTNPMANANYSVSLSGGYAASASGSFFSGLTQTITTSSIRYDFGYHDANGPSNYEWTEVYHQIFGDLA
tara:strand:+ start:426 stop:839 length:414 start_codon:yes stop_codon:yes gene_type:complete